MSTASTIGIVYACAGDEAKETNMVSDAARCQSMHAYLKMVARCCHFISYANNVCVVIERVVAERTNGTFPLFSHYLSLGDHSECTRRNSARQIDNSFDSNQTKQNLHRNTFNWCEYWIYKSSHQIQHCTVRWIRVVHCDIKFSLSLPLSGRYDICSRTIWRHSSTTLHLMKWKCDEVCSLSHVPCHVRN